MKKIVSLIIAIILLLSIAIACNTEKQSTSSESQANVDSVKSENAVSTAMPAQTDNSSVDLNDQNQKVENSSADNPKETDEPAIVLEKPVNVAALIGPTGIGLTYLTSYSNFFSLELFTAPDQVTAKIINGEVDIAAVPVNLASVLYNKTKGAISVIAVNTLGVLYIVERGDSIHSVQDLAGKTIYATGQASTPQYIFEQILAQNGLADNVTVEYVADGSELATKLVNGDVEIALLPEPQVSVACIQSQNEVRVALSINDLWSQNNNSSIVQGVYIVRNEFLENYKPLVDRFMEDAAVSANKVITNENAPADVVAAGILPKEPIAKRAIPNCNICFVSGDEMVQLVSGMLETLYSANPSSVGGTLPDDAFYYKNS